eukprot:m51a1_g9383 putative copper chaperone (73) ;mRNA; r:226390-226608
MSDSKTLSFKVSGMSCGACAKKVRERFLAVPGVTAAVVDADEDSAQVTCAASVQPESIASSLAGTKFAAALA